jgi:hypothetical protein
MARRGLDDRRGLMDPHRVAVSWRRRRQASVPWFLVKMSRWKMAAWLFEHVKWCAFRVCWTDLSFRLTVWHFGEAIDYLMMCLGVRSGHKAPTGHPLIKLVGDGTYFVSEMALIWSLCFRCKAPFINFNKRSCPSFWCKVWGHNLHFIHCNFGLFEKHHCNFQHLKNTTTILCTFYKRHFVKKNWNTYYPIYTCISVIHT